MPPVAAVSILPSTLAVAPSVPTDGGASASGFQHAMTARVAALPDFAATPAFPAFPATAVARDTGLTLAATLATAGIPAGVDTAPAPVESAPIGLLLPDAGTPDPAPAIDAEPTPPPIALARQPSASPKAPIANGTTIDRPIETARVDAPTPATDAPPGSTADVRPTPQAPVPPMRKPIESDEPAPEAIDPAATTPLTPPVPPVQPAPQRTVGQAPATEGAPLHNIPFAPTGGMPSARTPDRAEAAGVPGTATDTSGWDATFAPTPHKPQDGAAHPSPSTEPQTASSTATPATATVTPAAQPPAAQPGTLGTLPAPASPPPPPPPSPLPPRPPIDAGTARAVSIGRDVAVAITRHAARDGASTLTIRLDPVELGRVEVRMQIDSAGKMLATISAEQTTALDLLRRDATILAQTLSQAGVQADAASFRFDAQPGPRNGGGNSGAGNTGSGNAGGGNADRGWTFAAPSRHPGDGADDSRTTPARSALHASGRINLVA